MKKKSALAVISAFLISSGLSAGPNHGTVIKSFYAPYGTGLFKVPYDDSANGGKDFSSDSSGNADDDFGYFSGYSVSCGYFYDWFQGDVSYTKVETSDLYVVNVSTRGNENYSDAVLWNADIRGGYRFGNPGDTSYRWLYLGLRRTGLAIDFNNTEVSSLGLIAGFYGFTGIGLSAPVEFVFTYDIYAGTSRRDQNRLRTDVNMAVNRRYAFDFGLSAGAGIQYEPWDLALVLKFSSFITQRNYKGTYNESAVESSAALIGTVIGLEIVFSIPEYKYNIAENNGESR